MHSLEIAYPFQDKGKTFENHEGYATFRKAYLCSKR